MKYQVIEDRIILISGSDIDMANIKDQLEILDFCQVGENTWKFESNSTEIFNWVWTRMMVTIRPSPIFAHEEELLSISRSIKEEAIEEKKKFIEQVADEVIRNYNASTTSTSNSGLSKMERVRRSRR